jgi:orotidine-5'-phosphate decarboxylase
VIDAERLIVALDLPNLNLGCRLVKMLEDVITFKVGSQLFVNSGPESVRALQLMGKKVFLDLKFHDIPNTVAKATESATELGVDMFTVHVSSGFESLCAAVESSRSKAKQMGIQPPLVLGVTLLTSVNEDAFQRDFGSQRKVLEQVKYMVEMAQRAGLDGVVASAQEAKMIKELCGDDLVIATPGIRLAEKGESKKVSSDDQQRITTPSEAVKAGATYLVVGRPVYQATDPQKAAAEIIKEVAASAFR